MRWSCVPARRITPRRSPSWGASVTPAGAGWCFRLLWVERGVAHPLRLDHQRRVEMVRRDGFEVDREVRVREPVELAAKAADNRVDVALLELAAALEQHVIDPVRRA